MVSRAMGRIAAPARKGRGATMAIDGAA